MICAVLDVWFNALTLCSKLKSFFTLMSVPSTSTSSSTTQPPFLVGDAGESVLPAIQAMTLSSVTGTSTSQYSAETLINIFERPITSLSQSVDVVMQTPDPEVILPGELLTVATRLCDPLAVTLPLHHSTPLEPPSSLETPTRFGTQQISPVSHQSQTPSEVFTKTHRPPEVFKCTRNRLAAGLRPDPLGELERSPRPTIRIRGPTNCLVYTE